MGYVALVFFVSRFCMVGFFLWLQSTAFINRGVSSSVLESATKVTCFQKPWTKVGHPECGICLADYELDDAIRTLPCSHHFHVACVDSWLKRYRNTCPFCEAPLMP